MAMIIGSPTRYIQGKGEMKNLCSYAGNFGKKLYVLTGWSRRSRKGRETAESFMRCFRENAA